MQFRRILGSIKIAEIPGWQISEGSAALRIGLKYACVVSHELVHQGCIIRSAGSKNAQF